MQRLFGTQYTLTDMHWNSFLVMPTTANVVLRLLNHSFTETKTTILVTLKVYFILDEFTTHKHLPLSETWKMESLHFIQFVIRHHTNCIVKEKVKKTKVKKNKSLKVIMYNQFFFFLFCLVLSLNTNIYTSSL